jgi:hypothetical protein
MVDSLLTKLLEQSPTLIVMGVGLYTLYKAYQDQIKYNREQDKLTADILSKLVPVVDGLKEGTLRTGASLDRNLNEFNNGQERIHDRLAAMAESISKLDITISAFMDHIKRSQ